MTNFAWFALAAVCEIAGCYAVWLWLRLGRSPWWMLPATASLLVFAWALTRVDAAYAGRAFAAYAGVYVVASLVWLFAIERTPPQATDLIGGALCLAGTGIILFGTRTTGS